jgi:hypothetical protein
MPHTYLRNLRRENITLGFKKRKFSTNKRKFAEPTASGNVFSPNLDLSQPYLKTRIEGAMLTQNSSKMLGNKPLNKLSKMGNIMNSI